MFRDILHVFGTNDRQFQDHDMMFQFRKIRGKYGKRLKRLHWKSRLAYTHIIMFLWPSSGLLFFFFLHYRLQRCTDIILFFELLVKVFAMLRSKIINRSLSPNHNVESFAIENVFDPTLRLHQKLGTRHTITNPFLFLVRRRFFNRAYYRPAVTTICKLIYTFKKKCVRQSHIFKCLCNFFLVHLNFYDV